MSASKIETRSEPAVKVPDFTISVYTAAHVLKMSLFRFHSCFLAFYCYLLAECDAKTIGTKR